MSRIHVTIDDASFDVDVQLGAPGHATATIDGQALPIVFTRPENGEPVEWMLVDGRSYEIVIDRQLHWIRSARRLHHLGIVDAEVAAARPTGGDGRVKAPIPGTIARVLVEAGARVEAGQPLLVLEAMKMENQISAPRAGTVERVSVAVGQSVALGVVLIEIA